MADHKNNMLKIGADSGICIKTGQVLFSGSLTLLQKKIDVMGTSSEMCLLFFSFVKV